MPSKGAIIFKGRGGPFVCWGGDQNFFLAEERPVFSQDQRGGGSFFSLGERGHQIILSELIEFPLDY